MLMIDEQFFTLWTDVVDVRSQPVNALRAANLPGAQFTQLWGKTDGGNCADKPISCL